LTTVPQDPAVLTTAAAALAGIRGAKSVAKVGMKTEVTALEVRAKQSELDLLERAINDVKAAGRVTGSVELVADETLDSIKVNAKLTP